MDNPPMGKDESTADLLPLPLPDGRSERMILFAVRRMASHGIRDAQAALIVLDLFGARFRRALVLLRAFMLEFALASQRTVTLAPCCSLRMTAHEAQMIAILRDAARNPAAAERALVRLSGNPCMCETLSAAAVFGRALDELELVRGS